MGGVVTLLGVFYHEDLPEGSLAQASDHLEICYRFGRLLYFLFRDHLLLYFLGRGTIVERCGIVRTEREELFDLVDLLTLRIVFFKALVRMLVLIRFKGLVVP